MGLLSICTTLGIWTTLPPGPQCNYINILSKINALALISLLPKIPQHLSQTPTQILPCLATALKTIIP